MNWFGGGFGIVPTPRANPNEIFMSVSRDQESSQPTNISRVWRHQKKNFRHRTTIIFWMKEDSNQFFSKSHLNFYSSHFVIKLSSMKRLFLRFFSFYLGAWIYALVLIIFDINFVEIVCLFNAGFIFYLSRCNWLVLVFITSYN